MPLPLRLRAFWTIYRLVDRAPVMAQPAATVRLASDRRRRLLRLPGVWLVAGRTDPRAVTSDTSAKASDGTALPLRVYRPRNADPAEPLPVVVNFHGGGWVSGDVRQSEWWCSALAAEAGVAVVSVEYRLAPEHPFPVPVEDCFDATEWVAGHGDELGIDPARLAVMGDSAGGNMAAVVSLMARDRGGPAIGLQVLLYPSVDVGAEFPSRAENAHGPILTLDDLDNAPALYLQDASPEDPYASPLLAQDHAGLPPALIQTAQYDPLRDHGPAYAAALRAAGVPVRYTNYVEAAHGYISLPGVMPAAHQALAEVAQAVREFLAG